jgi:hypothetical protein
LSMIRADGSVPLKQSKTVWGKLHNPDSIMPNMNPGAVSKLLRTVGVDREGQDIVFQGIIDHSEQLIYDLSITFSRSMSIPQAEKGYNKDKIHLTQINLALLCSADTGFPTMIRSVPESVKDIKTLSNTIKEMDLEGKLLIENDCVMPMGLLKWCLDCAKNLKTPPGGIFSAVKAAFLEAAKTDLLDTVDRIYSFRNEYIAHQEKELVDREATRQVMKDWILDLRRIWLAK